MEFYSTVKFFFLGEWIVEVIWFPFSPLCVMDDDVVIFAGFLCCPMYMSEYLIFVLFF